jgi:hypothetical protein
MTRLLALFIAALVLNACEQHKAQELPEEFRERGNDGAKKSTAPAEHGAAPAATPAAPH